MRLPILAKGCAFSRRLSGSSPILPVPTTTEASRAFTDRMMLAAKGRIPGGVVCDLGDGAQRRANEKDWPHHKNSWHWNRENCSNRTTILINTATFAISSISRRKVDRVTFRRCVVVGPQRAGFAGYCLTTSSIRSVLLGETQSPCQGLVSRIGTDRIKRWIADA